MGDSRRERTAREAESRSALEDFFNNPQKYSPSGCAFDEDFRTLCDLLADAYDDVLSRRDVAVILRSLIPPPQRSFSPYQDITFAPAARPNEVIQSIVDLLASLPLKYTCEITLPYFLSGESDGVEARINDDIFIRFPQSGESAAVLEIRETGYYYPSSASPYVSKILTTIKIFLFLVSRISCPLFLERDAKATATVTEANSSVPIKFELPNGLDLLLGALTISIPTMRAATGNQFAYRDGTNLEIADSMQALWRVAEKLQISGNERIVASIMWYVDSLTAENETVAFLQSCIGLESLLGPDEQTRGLTRYLLRRLAEKLGNALDEKKYQEVLNVRGELVHGRQARLNSANQLVLNNARDLLKRVIDHEVERVAK